jgi:pimeloyl-ACP methyl ester carboxylesterase
LGGGINPYAYAGENPISHADPSGLLDVFVGGLSDSTSGIVSTYQKYYAETNPDRSSIYFQWNQGTAIEQAIRDALKQNPCEPINIIGHSYGGATAANVARDLSQNGIIPDLLETVDPVSYQKTPGVADVWVDINSAPATTDSSDVVAAIGHKWGNWPSGSANSYYTAPYHHGDFADLFQYKANGQSGLQTLLQSTSHHCQCGAAN